MTVIASKQEVVEANRRRYEELRAAGQEAKPKSLPGPTALDAAPIPPEAVINREEVPDDWYAIVRLKRGEALRIADPAGRSSVSMIAWRAEETSERINCADTVKVQWSAVLSKGRVILSDMGRLLFSLIEDTSGAHDLLVGGSTPASVFAAYGVPSRNTQENFIAGAAKVGLGPRDIPPCVSFFAPISVETAGRFRRPARGDECHPVALELRASAQPRASVALLSDHAGALPRAGRRSRRSLPDRLAGSGKSVCVHGSAGRLTGGTNDP